jgi:hypothetical protein
LRSDACDKADERSEESLDDLADVFSLRFDVLLDERPFRRGHTEPFEQRLILEEQAIYEVVALSGLGPHDGVPREKEVIVRVLRGELTGERIELVFESHQLTGDGGGDSDPDDGQEPEEDHEHQGDRGDPAIAAHPQAADGGVEQNADQECEREGEEDGPYGIKKDKGDRDDGHPYRNPPASHDGCLVPMRRLLPRPR